MILLLGLNPEMGRSVGTRHFLDADVDSEVSVTRPYHPYLRYFTEKQIFYTCKRDKIKETFATMNTFSTRIWLSLESYSDWTQFGC